MNSCVRNLWSFRVWLGFALLVLSCAEPLWAQNHQSSCVVTTRGGSRDALDVVFLLESSSQGSTGVLHFHVRPVSGPSSSDRELEILMTLVSSPYKTDVLRKSIVLKEGAASAEGFIPITFDQASDPTRSWQQYWNVRVVEEGRDIESSRALQVGPGGPYNPIRLSPGERPRDMLLQHGTHIASALHVLDTLEQYDSDVSQRSGFLNNPVYQGGLIPDTSVFDFMRDPQRSTCVRRIESLPEYWHYYLQFTLVSISEQALANLRSKRPAAAEALKQYIAGGGTLLFVAPEYRGPKIIDAWLAGKDTRAANALWDTDVKAIKAEKRQIRNASSDPTSEVETAAQADAPLEFNSWAVRPYVRGHIACFNTNAAWFPNSTDRRFQPAIGLTTSSAYDENWYLRNLIASVGKPPVWTFCAIILLFGMLLGPGLLVLTGWIGRRSLLILLVPLLSIGATLAIVAYEVLHEGFGSYARLSSVISIDEQTGDGFVWSRQNYFSGWPPKDGLTIPADVYLRPVNSYSKQSANTRSNLLHTIQFKGTEANWQGVLTAREQKQFLVGHPVKPRMPIKIERIDNKNARLRNLTDETLPFVVFRDGGTGYYFAEGVPPRSDIALSVQPFSDIVGALSRLRRLAPALPAELQSAGWAGASIVTGTEIIDRTWVGSLAEQSSLSAIEPYGFVTLIRNSDAIFMPMQAITDESSHMVTGSAAAW